MIGRGVKGVLYRPRNWAMRVLNEHGDGPTSFSPL